MISLVTTSVSALPQDKVQQYNIKVVPVTFVLDGHKYIDGVDISALEVYESLAHERPFLTSAPSPADYLNAFLEVGNRTRNILCLTVSKKFSMMYDSACTAAKELPPDINISIMDTGTAAGAQALIDLAVARAAEAGADLDEAIKLAEKLRGQVYLYALIVDPKYLARTGRVPSLLPKAASVLGIKPIITIREGVTKPVRVARTIGTGTEQMLTMMRNKVGAKPVRAIIQHANAREEAELLKQQVENDFLCTELYLTNFSPVMGFATGPGSLILSFVVDE